MSLLLVLTMVPAAGIQSALADEPAERPATTGGDVPLEGPAENTGLPAEEEAAGPVTATVREDGALIAGGLVYKSEGSGAVLVGFEDGASLEREVSVPEKLTNGVFEYTVKGVSITEGQSAPGVLALELPQTIEDVDTKSLAATMPALARVSVDGRGGAYSSANGMLFRQEGVTASSDGSTTRIANRELVWAPPAMVIARIPGTCKAVASGAFTDDEALETVMVFSTVESVAKAESGNITKEGAFTDEQVSKVNIVTPMETVVSSEGERINTDAFLSEDAPLNEKHVPWCDCGFSMDRFTVGIPYGSTSLAVAVPEDGRVGTPKITIGSYTGHPEWDPKGDTGEPANGLVFEYKADMTVSVTWKGDKNAIPSHLELPAYVVENGVKTAVTEVAPNAFEGATQLESVVVPEGVTTIGESAFAGCSNLKDASLPSTLRATGSSCFDGIPVGDSAHPIIRGAEETDESVRVGETLASSSYLASSLMSSNAGDLYAGLKDDSLGITHTNGSITAYASTTGLSEFNFSMNVNTSNVDVQYPAGLKQSGWSNTYCLCIEPANYPHKITYIDYTWRNDSKCSRKTLVFSVVLQDEGSTQYLTLTCKDGWVFSGVDIGCLDSSDSGRLNGTLFLVPESVMDGSSGIDKNVSDLANYYTKTASDGRYYQKSEVDSKLSGKASSSHAHDDRYFTETEVTNKLAGKSDTGHAHDTRYYQKSETYTKTQVDNLLNGKAASNHNHDASYYKKSETYTQAKVNELLAGKAALNHDHNSLYYTQAQLNDFLAKKADAGHNHDGAYAAKNHNHDGAYAKLGDFNSLKGTVGDASGGLVKTVNGHTTSIDSHTTSINKLNSALNGYTGANAVKDKFSEVGTALATKADKTEVSTQLDTKADKATVASDLAAAKKEAADALAGAKTELTEKIDGVEGKADANAEAIGALDAATVKASEFGSIEYKGLDGGDADVYPTSYRAGGTPSIHEPERDGWAFKGWSWSRANAEGGETVAGGGDSLAEAFSAAGKVTLTAEWEAVVPEANHFFTGDAPLKAGDASEYQTSVIKVRLSDGAWDLDKVRFTRNDATGLLKPGAALTLWVGSDPDVTNKGTRLDLAGDAAETQGGWKMPLARLDGDSWGVYVGVRVKTSDVNRDSLVGSLTDGSYVASLVKMYYRFA